jgi:hypothetical protein
MSGRRTCSVHTARSLPCEHHVDPPDSVRFTAASAPPATGIYPLLTLVSWPLLPDGRVRRIDQVSRLRARGPGPGRRRSGRRRFEYDDAGSVAMTGGGASAATPAWHEARADPG